MYAVIQTGGKQYKVAEGDRLAVEKLNVEAGTSLDIERVLMVTNGEQTRIGTPYLAGAKVTVSIDEHGKNDKVSYVKLRRRKHYRRQGGHRQPCTHITITQIVESS
ncbi:MAG: 50S ribosomal protein L21 [Candidatus Eutrophobiaceae bacterium]